MHIEDVETLKNKCIKQKFQFLTDSRDRNYQAYPTPSEYVINFDPPFRNVIGIEVVEASIPRTMYNVDVTNQQISFFIYDPATFNIENLQASHFTTVQIPAGDYYIQTLLIAVNDALVGRLNNDPNKGLVRITMEPVSTPAEVQSKLRFRCPYPFVMNFNPPASTIGETLGFDMYVPDSVSRPNSCRVIGPRTYVSSLALTGQTDYTLFEGPSATQAIESLTGQVVAQKFQVATPFFVTEVAFAASFEESMQQPIMYFKIFRGALSNLQLVGEYESGISFANGDLDTCKLPTPLELVPGDYWVMFQSGQQNLGLGLYYNDVAQASSSPPSLYRSPVPVGGGSYTWVPVDDNIGDTVQFNACMQVRGYDPFHNIAAPGLYALTGERYCVLRCTEIEANSFRSLSCVGRPLGIAKFRTTGAPDQEFQTNQVMQLVNGSIREFHPIGKLTRLSLRFERVDGGLYDFKGVNHTITFMITYYEPIQKEPWREFHLNRNYNGDFLTYNRYQEDQELSGVDSEEDDDPVWMSKMRLHEKQYGNGRNGEDIQEEIMKAIDPKMEIAYRDRDEDDDDDDDNESEYETDESD